MSNVKYKIIRNYVKFIASDDINYINKIINMVWSGSNKNKNNFQEGGDNYDDKLNFIIKNIELISKDIELFNKILNIIKKHDTLMIEFDPNYKKFNYDDNILNYLNKIYKNELIFV